MQRSLAKAVEFEGVALHSGAAAAIRVRPAPVNHGICFRRLNVAPDIAEIAANYANVGDTRLNTRITNSHGVSVATIEHLMAALAGLGIDNALVEIDGVEVPIMDGSSQIFVRGLLAAGFLAQKAAKRAYRVVKQVEMRLDDGAYAALAPDDHFHIDFSIDFSEAAIGRQSLSLAIENGVFLRELADCRTFARRFEVEALQAGGLGLGGSLDNAVIVDGDRVLNPGGFRRADECVRHKMLDAIGDLALIGGPIIGRYTGYKAGHGLTNALLRKAAQIGAMTPITLDPDMVPLMPGFNVQPRDYS